LTRRAVTITLPRADLPSTLAKSSLTVAALRVTMSGKMRTLRSQTGLSAASSMRPTMPFQFVCV
jgi:hypothetical protein